MKSASLIVDPNQTYESLKDLGGRLKPAPGWKFRAEVLEQDLVLTSDNGTVNITQDELGTPTTGSVARTATTSPEEVNRCPPRPRTPTCISREHDGLRARP